MKEEVEIRIREAEFLDDEELRQSNVSGENFVKSCLKYALVHSFLEYILIVAPRNNIDSPGE